MEPSEEKEYRLIGLNDQLAEKYNLRFFAHNQEWPVSDDGTSGVLTPVIKFMAIFAANEKEFTKLFGVFKSGVLPRIINISLRNNDQFPAIYIPSNYRQYPEEKGVSPQLDIFWRYDPNAREQSVDKLFNALKDVAAFPCDEPYYFLPPPEDQFACQKEELRRYLPKLEREKKALAVEMKNVDAAPSEKEKIDDLNKRAAILDEQISNLQTGISCSEEEALIPDMEYRIWLNGKNEFDDKPVKPTPVPPEELDALAKHVVRNPGQAVEIVTDDMFSTVREVNKYPELNQIPKGNDENSPQLTVSVEVKEDVIKDFEITNESDWLSSSIPVRIEDLEEKFRDGDLDGLEDIAPSIKDAIDRERVGEKSNRANAADFLRVWILKDGGRFHDFDYESVNPIMKMYAPLGIQLAVTQHRQEKHGGFRNTNQFIAAPKNHPLTRPCIRALLLPVAEAYGHQSNLEPAFRYGSEGLDYKEMLVVDNAYSATDKQRNQEIMWVGKRELPDLRTNVTLMLANQYPKMMKLFGDECFEHLPLSIGLLAVPWIRRELSVPIKGRWMKAPDAPPSTEKTGVEEKSRSVQQKLFPEDKYVIKGINELRVGRSYCGTVRGIEVDGAISIPIPGLEKGKTPVIEMTKQEQEAANMQDVKVGQRFQIILDKQRKVTAARQDQQLSPPSSSKPNPAIRSSGKKGGRS